MRKAVQVLALLAVLSAASASRGQDVDGPQADAYPIIAQLYADPSQFTGRLVSIYGLVVDSTPSGTFMLQDVSQHPLKIVGDDGNKAAVGDQLIVVGLFYSSPEGPYIYAKTLIRTRVLAGGGCC
jgi:hypothetical protein